MRHGEHSNSTKYTYVIIFLNIQMNCTLINTITLWFTISMIKVETNSHNRMWDMWRQILTTTNHQPSPRNKVNWT